MRNLSYENDFRMQFHFHANQSHFNKNGFALRLALKQRHKGTRKWPIADIVQIAQTAQTWRKLHRQHKHSANKMIDCVATAPT